MPGDLAMAWQVPLGNCSGKKRGSCRPPKPSQLDLLSHRWHKREA